MLMAHLLWGIFFFYFTSKSMGAGAPSLLSNRNMILNTAFPRAVFPIVSVIRGFLDFVPTFFIYVLIIHPLLGQPYGPSMALLPLILVMLTLFNFGCVLFFAPLSVFFRDTTSFIPYITRIWLYATPILFTVSEIPANLLPILRFNPLFPFYAALEQIFTAQWPSRGYLIAAAAWSVAAFLIGAIVFLLREREFATRF
jgi:teichoic acid transport system permease protein